MNYITFCKNLLATALQKVKKEIVGFEAAKSAEICEP